MSKDTDKTKKNPDKAVTLTSPSQKDTDIHEGRGTKGHYDWLKAKGNRKRSRRQRQINRRLK